MIDRGLTRGVNGLMRILIRRRELMFRNLPSNTIRYSRLIKNEEQLMLMTNFRRQRTATNLMAYYCADETFVFLHAATSGGLSPTVAFPRRFLTFYSFKCDLNVSFFGLIIAFLFNIMPR